MRCANHLKSLFDLLDSSLSLENARMKKNSVEAVKSVVGKLGIGEKTFKIIHIAGSKGKGSVANILGRILYENGKNCGIFTSPHIISIFERILRGNGEFFSGETYEKGAEDLLGLDEVILKSLSWFELVLLFGLATFKNAGCEYVVLETGMGGRLDATNYCDSLVSAITSIELEHCQYLGGTIAQIAREKAGIIKKNQNVFCGNLPKDAENVMRATAEAQNAAAMFLAEKAKISNITYFNFGMEVDFAIENCGKMEKFHFRTKLSGERQAENIALCTLIARRQFDFPAATIEKAISDVAIPARFERRNVFFRGKTLNAIYDGAHTKESVVDLMNTLKSLHARKITLLFSCAQDKNPETFAEIFFANDFFNGVFVTIPGKFKKCDLDAIEKSFSAKCDARHIDFFCGADYEKIIAESAAFAEARGSALLVTGSFYLVAEAKKMLEELH